jgi:ribosome-associated heat shock protein Hsp15
VLKVIGFAERRGDASSARELYEDLQGSNLQAGKE